MSNPGRDPFFQSRTEWAKYKHTILAKYLRVWVSKLASRSKSLVFVDTCAGAGTYGEARLPGSPLLAAQFNDTFLRQRNARLLVIACERRPVNVVRLRGALEPYTSRVPPEALVLPGSYVERLPDIVNATRGVPTIFFIDPYGIKDLTVDNLRPILEDRLREPTEILVRVPPQMLARFAGWLRKTDHDDRTRRTAAAFHALLQRLAIDEELLAQAGGAADDAPHYMEMMYSYLSAFSSRFKYVTPVPIRPAYFAAPKYYLVHGTDSEHGLVHMNDVVSTTEDELFRLSEDARSGGQASLFPSERPATMRVSIQDAQREILGLVRRFSAISWIEVRAKLVLAFGPDLRAKDHERALKALLQTELNVIPGRDGAYRRFRLKR